MTVNILRGENQIGGSIIEVSSECTRLIFDIGLNLDDGEDVILPTVDGLFSGAAKYDAVFISHYHPDHIGLVNKVVPNIPIYAGKSAVKIMRAASTYLVKDSINISEFIEEENPVLVGDITVTPYICDHSAFDSFMFLIECEQERILYTGDFRANGRKDFETLLEKLPTVHTLIVEGTTLAREGIKNITEIELEDIAVKMLEKHTGPTFVMMSAQNIDRLITIHNVAKRTNKIFAQDIYTAMIGRAASSSRLIYSDSSLIKVFTHNNSENYYNLLLTFGESKISRQAISKSNYIMSVRPSLKSYLEKLSALQSFEDGVLFYSMWKGYQEGEYISDFLEFMKSKGVKIHTLHTSGHADEDTIRRLIEKVMPQEIIPVHTENPEWFQNNY